MSLPFSFPTRSDRETTDEKAPVPCVQGLSIQKGARNMEINKKEMAAILRLIEAKTIFKSPEEFNVLYELWEKIRDQTIKDCEECDDD